MKTSCIATVLNEEATIRRFLQSIDTQSVLPDEVIVVDGGSSDATYLILKEYQKKHRYLTVRQKKGNRSVGRNEAIRVARNEIILCTDAGCILQKNWVKHMLAPFTDRNVMVVAGYYAGIADTLFQKCVIPYTFVMPDKLNEDTFLPASRSMAFRKSIWESVGGFPEQFSHNEDYVFAKTLQKNKTKIYVQGKAIVFWIPPTTWHGAYIMFYRFAKGDAQAHILRGKVLLLFGRYIAGIFLIGVFLLFHVDAALYVFIGLFFAYILWSIQKNYAYVRNSKAAYLLPLLQFLSDAAVFSGTSEGLLFSEIS